MQESINTFTDSRCKPRIKTRTICMSAFIMVMARLGSLNGLRQTQRTPFWKECLGTDLPSEDTIGRVFTFVQVGPMRDFLMRIYQRLKRNKALMPTLGSRFAVVLDGHESNASFLRCCEECLERTVRTAKRERVQYYHRNVVALLLSEPFPFLLDVEAQRKGESEIGAAIRLMKRLLDRYGRGFQIVVVDALYAHTEFFKLAISHGKEVIAVLKENRIDLLRDSLGIFANSPPVIFTEGNKTYTCWDEEYFSSWPQIHRTVRVVRSVETTSILRQKDGKQETKTSQWVWVGTTSKQQVPTQDFIRLAHARWVIENQELNELVNYWHADHLYKHHSNAILAFWLIALLAYNLFHAFLYLNVKAIFRKKFTKLHWARVMATELYHPLRC